MRGCVRRRVGVSGRAEGYAYLFVLGLVALIGIGLAVVAQVWSTASQREREQELLFIGHQFRAAIRSYYDASPGAKQYPRSIADLLEDKRSPTVVRHLRRPYVDPMTGKNEWGLVRQGDWIVGVYSLSTAKPIKSALFAADDVAFADAATYADWRFIHQPGGPQQAGAPAGGAVSPNVTPQLVSTDPTAMPAGLPVAPTGQAAQTSPRSWDCTATLSSEMRQCERASSAPSALAACNQAAEARHKSCMERVTQ